MSIDGRAELEIAKTLAHLKGTKATALQIAEATAAAWHAIDATLATIVGASGAAALYQRSLFLNSKTHACLGTVAGTIQTSIDPAALKAVLAQQSAEDAATVGAAVFQTFYELLTSLVGPSLTERLLHAVWVPFLSGPPSQDN